MPCEKHGPRASVTTKTRPSASVFVYWVPRAMFFTRHGRPWSNPTAYHFHCISVGKRAQTVLHRSLIFLLRTRRMCDNNQLDNVQCHLSHLTWLRHDNDLIDIFPMHDLERQYLDMKTNFVKSTILWNIYGNHHCLGDCLLINRKQSLIYFDNNLRLWHLCTVLDKDA